MHVLGLHLDGFVPILEAIWVCQFHVLNIRGRHLQFLFNFAIAASDSIIHNCCEPYTGKSLCALSFAPALSPATCSPRARYGPTMGMLYANPAIVLKNLDARVSVEALAR